MAEPLGIAVSALAVAETAIKLVEVIYDICKAEKQLQPLVEYVELASIELTQIGALLKDEANKTLFKQALLAEVKKILKRCITAFASLDRYLKTIIRSDTQTGQLTTMAKLTWTWKQKDFAMYMAQLERCQTSLNRLLVVMVFAVTSRYVSLYVKELPRWFDGIDRNAEDTRYIKWQVKQSMILEVKARERYDSLTAADDLVPNDVINTKPNSSNGTRDLSSGKIFEANTSRELSMGELNTQNQPLAKPAQREPTAAVTIDHHMSAKASEINQGPARVMCSHNLIQADAPIDHHNRLLLSLEQCARAIDTLSSAVNRSISTWKDLKRHEQGSLQPGFSDLRSAMRRLAAEEIDLTPGGWHWDDCAKLIPASQSLPKPTVVISDAQSGQPGWSLPRWIYNSSRGQRSQESAVVQEKQGVLQYYEDDELGSFAAGPKTKPRSKADDEDLKRRGHIDERTVTMSGGRLFVSNPDLSDDEMPPTHHDAKPNTKIIRHQSRVERPTSSAFPTDVERQDVDEAEDAASINSSEDGTIPFDGPLDSATVDELLEKWVAVDV